MPCHIIYLLFTVGWQRIAFVYEHIWIHITTIAGEQYLLSAHYLIRCYRQNCEGTYNNLITGGRKDTLFNSACRKTKPNQKKTTWYFLSVPAGWWQERPLKHIELLSLFIPQRIIDQSELWCCFNNVQFTIHWLPSTHGIINFTDLFSKSTWFCTIWEGGRGRSITRRRWRLGGEWRKKAIFPPLSK